MDKIEKYVNDAGSDSLDVFGGKFEGGIHLQQIPDEIAPCIKELMNHDIKSCLEIGSAGGGLVALLNHFLELGNILIIDDNQHNKAIYRPSVLKDIEHSEIIGDSTTGEVIKQVKGKFDLIIIDGNHDLVETDFDNYKGLLSDTGLIMFHDTVHWSTPAVNTFIGKMKRKNGYKLLAEYVSETHISPCGIALFKKER